jgi:enolase
MIKDIKIWIAFTANGKTTLAAQIITKNGIGTASVPAGISVGQYEAKALSPIKGQAILKKIKKQLIGKNEADIDIILKKIDPSSDFSYIGANIALALSLAAARSIYGQLWKIGKPKAFPIPVVNIIGGGAHGGGTDWQEFLAIPVKAKSPYEAVQTAIEIWQTVGHSLSEKGLLKGRNSEGAWMAKLDDVKTLQLLADVCADWGCKIGLDCAASQLWDGYSYSYNALWRVLRPDQQIDFLTEICQNYKIAYIEDPLHQGDFSGFSVLTSNLKKCLIVGDDLYCTRPELIEKGIKERASNGIIIKPNQVGTLTLAEKAVELAKRAGMVIIPSHRSQETEDDWIVDLALAWQAPLIKIGLADMPKFNRLAELWQILPKRMAQFKI